MCNRGGFNPPHILNIYHIYFSLTSTLKNKLRKDYRDIYDSTYIKVLMFYIVVNFTFTYLSKNIYLITYGAKFARFISLI